MQQPVNNQSGIPGAGASGLPQSDNRVLDGIAAATKVFATVSDGYLDFKERQHVMRVQRQQQSTPAAQSSLPQENPVNRFANGVSLQAVGVIGGAALAFGALIFLVARK